MTREMVFEKYFGAGNDYLIFDVKKNNSDFDKNILRKIHNRNFGMGLSGVLVGPYMEDGSVHMKVFNEQGDLTAETEDDAYMSSRYLNDAGYLEKNECDMHSGDDEIRVGKIYCWC